MKTYTLLLFVLLLFVIYSCEDDVSPPVADFTASTTEIEEGETITFTDQSTNSPTFWSWDFGDGGTGSEQNPSYTYDSVGHFTVILVASNNYGSDNETKRNYITITHDYGSMTDIDDNVYKTIQIGDQVWMAENLRVTHYPNGDFIPTTLEASATWEPEEYQWVYEHSSEYDIEFIEQFGRLYTYTAASKACPDGWRLPTESDVDELRVFLEADILYPTDTYYYINIGNRTKIADLTYWKTIDGVTNSTGLSIVGGGVFQRTHLERFIAIRDYGDYWLDDVWKWSYSTDYDNVGLEHLGAYEGTPYLNLGMTVRCIKDE